MEIMSSIGIGEWRILGEVDVNHHYVESAHGKNGIIAESAKRLHFDALVDCTKLLEELFLLELVFILKQEPCTPDWPKHQENKCKTIKGKLEFVDAV